MLDPFYYSYFWRSFLAIGMQITAGDGWQGSRGGAESRPDVLRLPRLVLWLDVFISLISSG